MGTTWLILISRRLRICMAKGGRESKMPGYGRLLIMLLDMRIHRDPPYLAQKCNQKCLETNTSQVLDNCGSFSPPLTQITPDHTRSFQEHAFGAHFLAGPLHSPTPFPKPRKSPNTSNGLSFAIFRFESEKKPISVVKTK